ncbi:hypothetical protein [Dietzia psychralcaliphila]|uniref:hypothetical protein n=1 Tax=Dietzia psychralcaliphila TaxID=139021 RepID=UPI000D4FB5FB|nr:hypothetical protein [Dietzia psychralcaliphila]PTM89708.1 hypothetical protein C8N39_102552 [Dietzia psychralcaliphila]
MDSTTARWKIRTALHSQNFRAVDLATLVSPSTIDFASVPRQLTEAINGALRTSTNWGGIQDQLSILRDQLDSQGRYIWDVYVGASHQTLKLVVVVGFGGPVHDTHFKTRFDATWVVMQSLEAHIRQFKLDPQLMALLDTARKPLLAQASPPVKAALDLSWTLLNSSRASGGPSSVLFAACGHGLSPDLGTKLRQLSYSRARTGLGAQPMLQGIAWDFSQPKFSDDQLYFGILNTFSSADFKATMRLS